MILKCIMRMKINGVLCMRKLLSRRCLFVLTLLSLIVFGVVLYNLSMLPFKYYIVVMGLLLVALSLLYIYENDKKKEHKLRTTVLKLVQIILSVGLVVASLTMLKGSNFLSDITSGNEQTIEVDVVVLKDSSYSSLNDLKDKIFGANTSVDAININKAKTMIEDKLDVISLYEYSNYQNVIDALKTSTIDAMIVKTIDMDSLDSIENGFMDNVKVIEKCVIKVPSVEANSAFVTKEAFNVYISGTDKKGDINTFALSDVNMVASINPITKQILLISIPRDYYVDLDTQGTNLEGVTGKDKLTHSAKGGINCSIQTVEKMLDIEMNYYAKFNFTSFLNIVDALGGVTVDIPKYKVYGNDEGIFTTVKGNYTMKPGIMEMNADQALCFVRERKSFVEGVTIRGKNQMLMFKSILKKCISPSIIVKMDGVFEALSGSFETNMSANDIKALINMQISDMSSWDIVSYSLKGDSSFRAVDFATIGNVAAVNRNGLYVTQPDNQSIDDAKSYIQTIMNNEILKIEK